MEKNFICTVCGHVGKPKKTVKGSILIELFLWCLLLVPGLIYSIWRLTTKATVCVKCSSANIVPLDSPVGAELMKKYHPQS